jgi:hypothetical protein
MISLSMVVLMVIAGMVMDFGFARYDRQINKATADAAVAAGMRSFDQDDGQVYTFRGVCDAIGYLRTNEPKLASLPAYAPCSSTPTKAKTCNVSDSTTFASYTGNTTDGRYTVAVKSPYALPDAAFPEDSLTSLSSDNGDQCLQLGVVITQRRDPGLGKIATQSQLVTNIRSVGRVQGGPGNRSPALLLLDRHNCNVLSVGSSGNQNSYIHVYGAASGTVSQPGTIHADSDGSACRSNETIFAGSIDDGIVAYAKPDLTDHGYISSYAARLGVAQTVVADGLNRVYGSAAANELGAGAATKYPVSSLGLITRKLVDDRYLPGLRTQVTSAGSKFTTITSAATATANGYVVLNSCTGNNQAEINALDATKPLYVDCTPYKGTGSIPNRTVFFKGMIGSQATTLMPNATTVYIVGGAGDSVDVSGGFQMHHHGASSCPNTPQNESAKLYVRAGNIKNNNAAFRACNTVVVMLGGQNDACLPTAGTVQPPTATPCSGGTGSGQLKLGGGGSGATVIDWTAPNQYDADITSLTDAQKQAAWSDQEDLAFWSESYGGNSNPSYTMAGGSGLHLVGVFMTPNASPFTVTGGGGQTLNNAQYIANSFQVNGGASLTMVVDPNNTVTLPKLRYFDLVR